MRGRGRFWLASCHRRWDIRPSSRKDSSELKERQQRTEERQQRTEERQQRHECGNWERGRAVSFLGIYKSDLLDAVRFECKQPIKLSGIWKIEDIWLEKEKQRSHLIDICLPLYLLIILWVWGEKILLAKRETLLYQIRRPLGLVFVIYFWSLGDLSPLYI
jgi:hypothetical protein